MKKETTLYVSDLDGTLLNQSAKLSLYTMNTINAMIEKGLNFSIATARSLLPVQKMLKGMKISIPIILLNGVLIYDTNKEEYIKINKIQTENVSEIIRAVREFDVSGFMYELENNGSFNTYHELVKNSPAPKYILERVAKYDSVQPPNGLSGVSLDNIVYFTLIDTYEKLLPLYEFFSQKRGIKQEFYKNVYNPEFWFLELFSEQSSKKSAVEFLKEKYNFEHVVGFGDNNNDFPLFDICDIRVAVENATSKLKKAATHICVSNNDDGVAKWLEKNFDNE